MILKWIQSILPAQKGDPHTDVNAVQCSRKASDAELMDIVHEVMRNSASDLNGLVNLGQPVIDRKKLKEKIRSNVKKRITKEFDDDEVVEEVTERILDAAEFDPYYQEMFDE